MRIYKYIYKYQREGGKGRKDFQLPLVFLLKGKEALKELQTRGRRSKILLVKQMVWYSCW